MSFCISVMPFRLVHNSWQHHFHNLHLLCYPKQVYIQCAHMHSATPLLAGPETWKIHMSVQHVYMSALQWTALFSVNQGIATTDVSMPSSCSNACVFGLCGWHHAIDVVKRHSFAGRPQQGQHAAMLSFDHQQSVVCTWQRGWPHPTARARTAPGPREIRL